MARNHAYARTAHGHGIVRIPLSAQGSCKRWAILRAVCLYASSARACSSSNRERTLRKFSLQVSLCKTSMEASLRKLSHIHRASLSRHICLRQFSVQVSLRKLAVSAGPCGFKQVTRGQQLGASFSAEQGCGIKGFLPASVIQGNPPLYEENSLWETLSVVSQKWSFPTALLLKVAIFVLERTKGDARRGPLLPTAGAPPLTHHTNFQLRS